MKSISLRELHERTDARPGYARLPGKLGRGTDSTAIVSEDRERASPS